jgi:polyhydroxyalkanoate synthesis repressor PhaR
MTAQPNPVDRPDEGSDNQVIVKKYSNRRLYDTSASRYITLEELTEKIRGGEEVKVIDAKSGADITQATLAQIIVESRGAARLLPVPLLTQLIRMGDDALAEFFSQYMAWFFEIYLQMKQGAQAASPLNPFSLMPFAATSALSKAFTSTPPPAKEEPPDSEPATRDEIFQLRREMEALKKELLKNQAKDE